jgi:hypothetical protein
MSIDAALSGIVVRDAELRTSAAGKPWMSVIVRSGDGDAASFVQAAISGDAAVALDRDPWVADRRAGAHLLAFSPPVE